MFEPLCACPGNQSSEIFHLIEYIFYHSAFLRNFALVPKNGVCPEFTVLNTYFSSFKIFEHLLWKTELFWNFSLYWKHNFYHSRFLSNLCLLWKIVVLKFFAVLKCFLPFSIFEKLCACPEKRSVPWIHCIEYIFFIIQDFWALALRNRVVLKFLTVLKTILIIQDFWATCACSEKQLFWNFSLYWNMFYHSGFSSNFRLPWQQSLPWYFLL